MNKPAKISSKDRVAKRRAALRAQGLRPKQFWLPDVNSAEFRAEAQRQSLLVAVAMKTSDDDVAFAQAAQYWPDDDD